MLTSRIVIDRAGPNSTSRPYLTECLQLIDPQAATIQIPQRNRRFGISSNDLIESASTVVDRTECVSGASDKDLTFRIPNRSQAQDWESFDVPQPFAVTWHACGPCFSLAAGRLYYAPLRRVCWAPHPELACHQRLGN